MTITIIPNWPLRHRLRHTATSTQVAQARLRKPHFTEKASISSAFEAKDLLLHLSINGLNNLP